MELRGERCYTSKESNLRVIDSEQRLTLFAFVLRRIAKFPSPHGENVQNVSLEDCRKQSGFHLLASQKIVLENHLESSRSSTTRSIKHQNASLLRNEKRGRWRDHFKDVSN